MALVTVTHTYDASKDKVWKLLADIGNVHEISSFIEASEKTNEQEGEGARRSCDFGDGRGVVEEVTNWKPGEAVTFTAVQFRKMPLKHMVATFRLAEVGDRTTVACAMDFSARGGFVGNLFAKPRMKKAIRAMLDGIEQQLGGGAQEAEPAAKGKKAKGAVKGKTDKAKGKDKAKRGAKAASKDQGDGKGKSGGKGKGKAA